MYVLWPFFMSSCMNASGYKVSYLFYETKDGYNGNSGCKGSMGSMGFNAAKGIWFKGQGFL